MPSWARTSTLHARGPLETNKRVNKTHKALLNRTLCTALAELPDLVCSDFRCCLAKHPRGARETFALKGEPPIYLKAAKTVIAGHDSKQLSKPGRLRSRALLPQTVRDAAFEADCWPPTTQLLRRTVYRQQLTASGDSRGASSVVHGYDGKLRCCFANLESGVWRGRHMGITRL